MVMLSFGLPNYMEYACKASKKVDHNIFRSIFGTGYFIGISLHVGVSKRYSKTAPLNWHSYQ